MGENESGTLHWFIDGSQQKISTRTEIMAKNMRHKQIDHDHELSFLFVIRE